MSWTEGIRPIHNFPYFNNYDIWARDEDTLFVMSSAGIYVVRSDDLIADQPNMPCELLDARMGLTSALTANSWTWNDGGSEPPAAGGFVAAVKAPSTPVR